MGSTREVKLTRLFDAPPAQLFELWTRPEHLKHWFGPRTFTTPEAEVDLKVGGRYRIVMRGPDGTDYPCGGEYREILPGKKLVFTNNAYAQDGEQLLDGVTTVTFEAEGRGTRLTVVARATALKPIAEGMLQGMEEGWNQTVDKLSEHAKRV